MGVEDERGPIDSILCPIDDPLYTVTVGELVRVDTVDMIKKAGAYPDNCPRQPGFDETAKLGCTGCAHAEIIR